MTRWKNPSTNRLTDCWLPGLHLRMKPKRWLCLDSYWKPVLLPSFVPIVGDPHCPPRWRVAQVEDHKVSNRSLVVGETLFRLHRLNVNVSTRSVWVALIFSGLYQGKQIWKFWDKQLTWNFLGSESWSIKLHECTDVILFFPIEFFPPCKVRSLVETMTDLWKYLQTQQFVEISSVNFWTFPKKMSPNTWGFPLKILQISPPSAALRGTAADIVVLGVCLGEQSSDMATWYERVPFRGRMFQYFDDWKKSPPLIIIFCIRIGLDFFASFFGKSFESISLSPNRQRTPWKMVTDHCSFICIIEPPTFQPITSW